jgi:hypothetical protein
MKLSASLYHGAFAQPRCLIAGIAATFLLMACAPKIYIIDRQTVLEQEAAGEWPQFEKEIVAKSLASGPTAFPKVPVTTAKKRLYQVLNGELVGLHDGSASQPASAGLSPVNGAKAAPAQAPAASQGKAPSETHQ